MTERTCFTCAHCVPKPEFDAHACMAVAPGILIKPKADDPERNGSLCPRWAAPEVPHDR